ncbi:hypothetical protein O3M35_000934 [Rhynocoris fuscipes]|uniref:Nucleoporin NSP1-like C-terminal domain-containing protein n=1 Tax=Rhynocoris fuscipes TaxID=488301 RepID=A0AAW1DPG6_9HEMI
MSLGGNQAQSGITTAQGASSTISNTFTAPIPSSTATQGSSPFQFKPPQTSNPSTNVQAPSSSATGFTLGGELLNQLKGHISDNIPVSSTTTTAAPNLGGDLLNQLKGNISGNAPTSNLFGTGDKKLGTGTTTLTTGTTSTSSQQTTSSITQPTGTNFLSTQAGVSDKQVSQMTYEELETAVNKLIGKLTDNEEEFTKIARELNEWDKAINDNYEKLLFLTETVKTVKSAQIKLSYDLDFIAIEHKDFESIIASCEKEVENYNFSHPSRHDVYQKAVNVDIQVRRMCEELREVIEHLNERLKFSESDDPVMQIGRVLNAHMESLKWVDENTTQIHDYINYLSQIQEQMKKKLPQIGN